MTDAERREEEVEKEQTKVSDIREKMKEITYVPYYYQPFNETECKDYRNSRFADDLNLYFRQDYRNQCPRYSSFKFPILLVIDGVVKPCSYSNLENITNFQTSLIQTTQLGRLFRGTIIEGSEE